MNMIDTRSGIRFGIFATATVFIPLAILAVIAAGSSDCRGCGADGFLEQALLLCAIYVLSFGAVTGCAAGLLKPALDRSIYPIGATLLIAAAIGLVAVPAVKSGPRIYLFVEYLRTPRDQLPPTDPRHRPSDCSRRTLHPDAVCAY